ncbi:MAG: class 1 fructose-bisphosphatase, partial [Gemmatimonadetes bacterium]|nr:class 1 fructose-bisphosphatase [Gemmatimonadota bacterium]
MTKGSVVTIERHIIEEERQFPEATGAFSNILYDIAFAAKVIAGEVRRAGLGN